MGIRPENGGEVKAGFSPIGINYLQTASRACWPKAPDRGPYRSPPRQSPRFPQNPSEPLRARQSPSKPLRGPHNLKANGWSWGPARGPYQSHPEPPRAPQSASKLTKASTPPRALQSPSIALVAIKERCVHQRHTYYDTPMASNISENHIFVTPPQNQTIKTPWHTELVFSIKTP